MSYWILSKQEILKSKLGIAPEAKEFKDYKQFLWEYRNSIDIDGFEELALVLVAGGSIIYNMWDSEHKLTYKILYDWFQQSEKQGLSDVECAYNIDPDARLYGYLKKHGVPKQQFSYNSDSVSDFIDNIENNTSSINRDKGVNRDYATYYTIFRGKR